MEVLHYTEREYYDSILKSIDKCFKYFLYILRSSSQFGCNNNVFLNVSLHSKNLYEYIWNFKSNETINIVQIINFTIKSSHLWLHSAHCNTKSSLYESSILHTNYSYLRRQFLSNFIIMSWIQQFIIINQKFENLQLVKQLRKTTKNKSNDM